MTDLAKTRLLDAVNAPADLKGRTREELKQLADEVRAEVIDAVSVTGGHLGAGLGVVELTVAIHSVFDTPSDKLIWDVGHQCYPHKILTGRKDRIRTLRQGGGLSGFTKRSESEYDPFGAAHASTSISAGHGFATSRELQGGDNHVISVIGDGSMTAGMAYEAMNNVGGDQVRLRQIIGIARGRIRQRRSFGLRLIEQRQRSTTGPAGDHHLGIPQHLFGMAHIGPQIGHHLFHDQRGVVLGLARRRADHVLPSLGHGHWQGHQVQRGCGVHENQHRLRRRLWPDQLPFEEDFAL